MTELRLEIVIPVYNEGGNIGWTLRALDRAVRTPSRILICYDREDDNSLPAVEQIRSDLKIPVQFVRNMVKALTGPS